MAESNATEIKRDKEEDNHQPKVLNTDNKTNNQNSTSAVSLPTPPDIFYSSLNNNNTLITKTNYDKQNQPTKVNAENSSVSFSSVRLMDNISNPHMITAAASSNIIVQQPEVRKRGRPKGYSPLNPAAYYREKIKKRKVLMNNLSLLQQQHQQQIPPSITTTEQKLLSSSTSSFMNNSPTPPSITTAPTTLRSSTSSVNDSVDVNTSTFTPNTSSSSSSSIADLSFSSSLRNENSNSFDHIKTDSPRPRTYQIQTRHSTRISTGSSVNESKNSSFQTNYLDESSMDLSLDYINTSKYDDDNDSIPEIDLNISSPNIRPLSPSSRSEHEVQTSPKLGENCNYPTSIYYGEKDRYRRDPKCYYHIPMRSYRGRSKSNRPSNDIYFRRSRSVATSVSPRGKIPLRKPYKEIDVSGYRPESDSSSSDDLTEEQYLKREEEKREERIKQERIKQEEKMRRRMEKLKREEEKERKRKEKEEKAEREIEEKIKAERIRQMEEDEEEENERRRLKRKKIEDEEYNEEEDEEIENKRESKNRVVRIDKKEEKRVEEVVEKTKAKVEEDEENNDEKKKNMKDVDDDDDESDDESKEGEKDVDKEDDENDYEDEDDYSDTVTDEDLSLFKTFCKQHRTMAFRIVDTSNPQPRTYTITIPLKRVINKKTLTLKIDNNKKPHRGRHYSRRPYRLNSHKKEKIGDEKDDGAIEDEADEEYNYVKPKRPYHRHKKVKGKEDESDDESKKVKKTSEALLPPPQQQHLKLSSYLEEYFPMIMPQNYNMLPLLKFTNNALCKGIVYKETGEMKQKFIKSEEDIVRYLKGQPKYLGSFDGLDVIVFSKLNISRSDKDNRSHLPYPLDQINEKGRLLLLRVDDRSYVDSLTITEWNEYLKKHLGEFGNDFKKRHRRGKRKRSELYSDDDYESRL